MGQTDLRWSTTFGCWVRSYGVRRLSTSLSSQKLPVSVSGVHEWLAGRSTPRLQTAVAIERLSDGAVRVEDICVHVERVRE